MGRRPIVLAFALFVVVAVVATIAMLTGDEPATEEARPSAAPLRLPDEPTWSAPAYQPLTSTVVRDGTVLAQNEDAVDVLDADTGATRWSLVPGKALLDGDGSRWGPWGTRTLLVPLDGEPAVLTEDFRCAACETEDLVVAPVGERGIALLSADDGRVLWRTRVIQAGLPELVEVLLADDRYVVLGLSNEGQREGERLYRTVAYDLRDGTPLWTVDGWPLAIAGDVVLLHNGVTPPPVDPGIGALREVSVRAVATATGAEKWDLAELYDRTELLLMAGDVAFVRGIDDGKKHTRGVVVTLDRGARLQEVGYGTFDGCATDGTELIACPRDGGLMTFQVADGALTTVPTAVEVGRVDAVWDDRIFVSHGPTFRTIDRQGLVIDKTLPGPLVGRTGDTVLFGDSDESSVDGYTLRE